MSQLLFSIALIIQISAFPHSYHDCTKIFNPQNYMDQLPSLSLPYVNKLAIPNSNHLSLFKPTPVVTTKVITVITKYVSKSPMCIKVEGPKPPCSIKRVSTKKPLEFLITKEYFVTDKRKKKSDSGEVVGNDGKNKFDAQALNRFHYDEQDGRNKYDFDGKNRYDYAGFDNKDQNNAFIRKEHRSIGSFEETKSREHKMLLDAQDELTRLENLRREIENYRNQNVSSWENLEGSEERSQSIESSETPQLELLIEDRLDKLEGILPYYTRKRAYKTSTITVTKTRTNSRTTATLTVKNCIPEGIEYCKAKKSSRRSPKKAADDEREITVAASRPQQQELNTYHYG